MVEPDEDYAGWAEAFVKAIPQRYFGAEMSERTKEALEMPEFIDLALVALEEMKHVEGMFRISGSKTEIDALRNLYNCGARPSSLANYDVHTLTGSLKMYLRMLPTPLVPFSHYPQLLQLGSSNSSSDIASQFTALLSEFPLQSQIVLKAICTFMQRVAKESATNQMTSSNLAIVVGPNLARPQTESLESATHAQYVIPVFTAVFENADKIFASVPDGIGIYFSNNPSSNAGANVGANTALKKGSVSSSNLMRKSVRPQPPGMLLVGLAPPPSDPSYQAPPLSPTSSSGTPAGIQVLPPPPNSSNPGVLPANRKSALFASAAGRPNPSAPPPTNAEPKGDGIQKSVSSNSLKPAASTPAGGLKRPVPVGAVPLPMVSASSTPEVSQSGAGAEENQSSDSSSSVPATGGSSSSQNQSTKADEDECAQWKTYTSDDGHKYYHNETLDVTTWEKPDCLKKKVKKHRKAPSATSGTNPLSGASSPSLSSAKGSTSSSPDDVVTPSSPSGSKSNLRRKTDRAQTTNAAPNFAVMQALAMHPPAPITPATGLPPPPSATSATSVTSHLPPPPAAANPSPALVLPPPIASQAGSLPSINAPKHPIPLAHAQSMPLQHGQGQSGAPGPNPFATAAAAAAVAQNAEPKQNPGADARIKALEDKVRGLEALVADQAKAIEKLFAALNAS